jgi:hypothetical protein
MNLRSLSTGLSASFAGSLALVTASALLEPVVAGPVSISTPKVVVKPVPQPTPQLATQPRYVLVPVDQIAADYPLPAPLPPRLIAQAPGPLPAPEPEPQPSQPSGQPLTAEQSSRRCNAGRLIGGLAGGGIGYMASRKDGRNWAVPLGALLGTQMGCPLAQGRGPLSLFGL